MIRVKENDGVTFLHTKFNGLDWFVKPLAAMGSGYKDELDIVQPLRKIPMKRQVVDGRGDLYEYTWVNGKPFFQRLANVRYEVTGVTTVDSCYKK